MNERVTRKEPISSGMYLPIRPIPQVMMQNRLNLQHLFWLPYSLVSPLVFLLLLKTETRQHPFTKVLCSSNNNGSKKSQLEGESDVNLR